MKIIVSIILLGTIPLMGNEYIQTDWSGGRGASPVTAWYDHFDTSAHIDWYNEEGQILLAYECYLLPFDVWGVQSPVPADIDADEDIDLVLGGSYDQDVQWFENLGNGDDWAYHLIDDDFSGWKTLFVADMDLDGDLDIAGNNSDCLVWYENQVPIWQKHYIDEWVYQIDDSDGADIDLDGDIDVVACSNSGSLGFIAWWENLDGTGTAWIEREVFPFVLDPVDIALADADGDGDPDVFCCTNNADLLLWFENDVLTSPDQWQSHTIGDVLSPRKIAPADLDGDGNMDLAVLSYSTGFYWFEQLNPFGWVKHLIDECPGYNKWIEVADVDRDGDNDLLAVHSSLGMLYLNIDGSFTELEHQVLTDDVYRDFMTITDFNGDSLSDIVYRCAVDSIAWFSPFTGIHSAWGELVSVILDTNTENIWDSINWDSVIPIGTSIVFQVRTELEGVYPIEMGPWSDPITNPGSLQSILEPGTQFVQYSLTMTSTNNTASPELYEVSVTTEITSIDRNTLLQLDTSWMVGPLPNPSYESFSLYFNLPDPGSIRISIYDISGRLMNQIDLSDLNSGFYQTDLICPNSGIYLLEATFNNNLSTACRLVVLR